MKSAFSQEKRAVSFRLNTLKATHKEIQEGLEKASIAYTQLDFPKDCYLLDSKFSESDLWKRRVYKDGGIYLQNVASQVPVLFFSQSSPLKILDACAAPGGKTSQLSALYPDAEIYAFEPWKVRYDKMRHNLEKLGCKNVTMVHSPIENITTHIPQENYFDMVLVDAPCSWEGSLFYNNIKFLEAWDISHINRNYKRQKRICDTVVPYLKTGWEMIYSTCTLAPEENEAVVHYMLCKYPELLLEKIEISTSSEIITKKALASFNGHPYRKEIPENCIRLVPSEFSEWFFMAKLIKKQVD